LFSVALATPLDRQATLMASTAGTPPNLTEIVRLYMNFGAVPGNASDYNCTSWSRLWNEDGIRQTPGMPGSQGWAQLEAMCVQVRQQFTALYCDDELEIDVMSYNSEKRTAFQWTVNGILAKTGEQVSVPAISTLFMDADGTIQTAWDFLDPSPFGLAPLPQESKDNDIDINEIVRQYMNFGGLPSYPHAADCSAWAKLFGETGVRNTPGVPPTRGYDQQLATCQSVRGQFETMLNFVEFTSAVTSWNNEKRVAFVWDIEGMSVTGNIIQKQAISSLFLWANGTIQYAWDFLDPKGIEP
jgi:hypothetical protein